jgi:LysM repeat protein
MSSRQRIMRFLLLLVVGVLMLAACERPLPGADTAQTPEEAVPTAPTGAEAPEVVAPAPETQPEAYPGESEETPRVEETPEEGAAPAEEGAGEAEEPGEAPAEPAAEPAAEPDEAPPAEGEQAGEEAVAAEESAEEAAAADPEQGGGAPATSAEAEATTAVAPGTTHVVAPGENLYRIGLKYGISWVTLAQVNNLPNPNRITVGQVLTISAAPPPPPAPPPTGAPYVVQRGDNLYRIGQAFGVSWQALATANNIVNPNQIFAGQVLTIPGATPQPQPAVTHLVQPGDTLFRISLRYGVPWTSIAAANNISSPYVIYVGQTLVIPGS